MADVWIMTNARDTSEDPDSWETEVTVVVLRNHKVLANNEEDEELLNDQIKMIQENYWEEDGNTGPIPSEELFPYLNQLHSSPSHKGSIVPIEEARRVMELSGGGF